jgi:hypothetical protein
MAGTTSGKKWANYTTSVGTTIATMIAEGVLACETGKLLIQNPHATANIAIGLAGESSLTVGSTGLLLAAGTGVVIDNPPNNAITFISDTASTPVICYGIPTV